MKKLFFIFSVAAFLTAFQKVKAQTLSWAKQFDGTEYDYAQSVAFDASGNVYTLGWFAGTSDFDPDPGIFITKLNASGNLIWAKQLGGTSNDYGYSLAVDDSSNAYAIGYFTSTAVFL